MHTLMLVFFFGGVLYASSISTSVLFGLNASPPTGPASIFSSQACVDGYTLPTENCVSGSQPSNVLETPLGTCRLRQGSAVSTAICIEATLALVAPTAMQKLFNSAMLPGLANNR